MPEPSPTPRATHAEQVVVAAMYDRLDELTSRASRDLHRAKRSVSSG